MSKDEVMKALQEINQQYAPITIDITPERTGNTSNRDKARVRVLSTDENGEYSGLSAIWS
jgi:hypothetical protein